MQHTPVIQGVLLANSDYSCLSMDFTFNFRPYLVVCSVGSCVPQLLIICYWRYSTVLKFEIWTASHTISQMETQYFRLGYLPFSKTGLNFFFLTNVPSCYFDVTIFKADVICRKWNWNAIVELRCVIVIELFLNLCLQKISCPSPFRYYTVCTNALNL